MKLSINDKQAQVLVEALDLYSRILIGQYEQAAAVGRKYTVPEGNPKAVIFDIDGTLANMLSFKGGCCD